MEARSAVLATRNVDHVLHLHRYAVQTSRTGVRTRFLQIMFVEENGNPEGGRGDPRFTRRR